MVAVEAFPSPSKARPSKTSYVSPSRSTQESKFFRMLTSKAEARNSSKENKHHKTQQSNRLHPQPKRTIIQEIVDRFEGKDRDFIDLSNYYGKYATKGSFLPNYHLGARPEKKKRRVPISSRLEVEDFPEFKRNATFNIKGLLHPMSIEKIRESKKAA